MNSLTSVYYFTAGHLKQSVLVYLISLLYPELIILLHIQTSTVVPVASASYSDCSYSVHIDVQEIHPTKYSDVN